MTESSTYDLVVGLGRSGVSMARFLKSLDRNVVAADIDPSRSAEAKALEALGIRTEIGPHDPETFDRADRILPSPGIPLTLPHIRRAADKGVEIIGELDIFSRYNTTPVIAVTGTNGKTTTTRLIGAMAEGSGLTVFVGGNIGTPLVEYLMSGVRTDLVVAEVSSFQLDLANSFRPDVGVLLNISPDHLDRYENYQGYTDSKWSLFARQNDTDTAVINAEIQDFSARTSAMAARVLAFSSRSSVAHGAEVTDTEIRIQTGQGRDCLAPETSNALPGAHNRENIAAASLAVLAAGGTMEGIRDSLGGFTPPDHRLAFVRMLDGVEFYNDSKATNTDAVIRALEAFDTPVVLILGGREKGTDFSELADAVTSGVKTIMAIGEAAGHISQTFGNLCPVRQCPDMADAVSSAFSAAGPGDVVLLSPACASFDMYANYEERGREFTALVNGLDAGKEADHGKI